MFGYGKNSYNNKNEDRTTAKQLYVSTTCPSGVWKLYGSQWKVDIIHPKLVEGSMVIYHWEI